MNNKLTTPKAILIGSFMIAGTILYTSENISNPIIRTAHASVYSVYESGHLSMVKEMINYLRDISRDTRTICNFHVGTSFCSNYR